MNWEISMIFVHGAAVAGLVLLFRLPPSWLQKLVLLVLLLAMGALIGGGVLWINGFEEESKHLYRLGLKIEHSGVLLWIFRLIYQDRVQWTSSPPSRNS